METVAISDVGTTLYARLGSATKFTKLLSITSAPAMGSAGGTLEVTVLDSATKQFIPDRVETPDQDFNYNYTEANFTLALSACNDASPEFLVVFQDGSGYTIEGSAQTWINEVGRGAGIEATLHIVASAIDWRTSAEVLATIAGIYS